MRMLDPELIKLASVNTYNYVHSCGLLFYINSIKYTYVTSAMCMVALITTDYVKSTSVAIIQGLLGRAKVTPILRIFMVILRSVASYISQGNTLLQRVRTTPPFHRRP